MTELQGLNVCDEDTRESLLENIRTPEFPSKTLILWDFYSSYLVYYESYSLDRNVWVVSSFKIYILIHGDVYGHLINVEKIHTSENFLFVVVHFFFVCLLWGGGVCPKSHFQT